MKNITATLKNLLRKGQHNIMKITSLAIDSRTCFAKGSTT